MGKLNQHLRYTIWADLRNVPRSECDGMHEQMIEAQWEQVGVLRKRSMLILESEAWLEKPFRTRQLPP